MLNPSQKSQISMKKTLKFVILEYDREVTKEAGFSLIWLINHVHIFRPSAFYK